MHVAGARDLRDEDGVELRARLLDDVDDVAIAPVGVEPVDAERDGAGRPVEVAERGDDALAGILLVGGGHGVLEVEHDDVGAEAGGLGEHAGVAAGHGELGAVQAESVEWHGRRSVGPAGTARKPG